MQSPEKLQARLKETAGSVERERVRLADAERHSRDLQTRLDAIAKARAGPCALLLYLLPTCAINMLFGKCCVLWIMRGAYIYICALYALTKVVNHLAHI